MKIKQVVVLAGKDHIDCSISSGLEQLGLQMCECFSPQDHKEDCLLVCDQDYADTSNGSALIRQAMERGCAVLLHNSNCPSVLEEIRSTGDLSQKTRDMLEAQVLYRCLQKDIQRLASLQPEADGLPNYVASAYEKVQDLRYGENWHQRAALYTNDQGLGLPAARKLNGREMSYNNMVDRKSTRLNSSHRT